MKKYKNLNSPKIDFYFFLAKYNFLFIYFIPVWGSSEILLLIGSTHLDLFEMAFYDLKHW